LEGLLNILNLTWYHLGAFDELVLIKVSMMNQVKF